MFIKKYIPKSNTKKYNQSIEKLDFRNEKKILFFESENYLINFLKFLNFKEVYYKRKINSIYFDTFDLIDLKDTIDGEKNRSKLRLRWYGNTFNSTIRPTLENKIKVNNQNFKIKQKLKKLKIKDKFSTKQIKEFMNDQKIDNESVLLKYKNSKPNIYISYYRRYFLNKKIRITLDSNLHSKDFYKKKNLSKYDYIVKKKFNIIEIKYKDDKNNSIKNIMEFINNRITKFSKYEYSLTNI